MFTTRFPFSKAKSQSNDGEFDYNSFLVRLRNLDSTNIDLLSPLLDPRFDWNQWTMKNYELALNSINTIALLAHEYTHFLDTTATTWGHEYTYRKLLILSEDNSDKLENRINVLQLNISEINNLHPDLIKTTSSNYNDLISMNHYYKYSEDHGSVVLIRLNYPNCKTDEIPVSMLAVNEGHAYCNETIYKFNLCKNIADQNLKQTLISIINKDFDSFINQTIFSEYNILIKLSHIHFKNFFTNEEVLYLTSAILGFSLDCHDMLLTSFSYLLEQTISEKNFFVAQAITQDMRRGTSRHYLAFKLILIFYEIYNKGDKYQDIIKNIAKNQESKMNFDLVIKYLLDEDPTTSKSFSFMKEYFEKLVKEQEKDFKNEYIFKELSGNSKIYEEDNYVITDLNKYKLIDFLLNDDSIIKFNNRVDLDIEEYYLTDLNEKFSIINKAYDKIKKFHMDPYETEVTIQNLKNNYKE